MRKGSVFAFGRWQRIPGRAADSKQCGEAWDTQWVVVVQQLLNWRGRGTTLSA